MKSRFKRLVTKTASKDPAWAQPWGSSQPKNPFDALQAMDLEDKRASSSRPAEHREERKSENSDEAVASTTEENNAELAAHNSFLDHDQNRSSNDWKVVSRSSRRGVSESSSELANRPVDFRHLDWNDQKKRRTMIEVPLAQNSTNGGKYPERKKPEHRSGARTRDGIPFSDIKPGVMMFHFDIRPMVGTDSITDDRKLVFDVGGVKWLRKGRYWLVISFRDDHIIELPIYSFSDQGLHKKADFVKDYYNSVKRPWSVDFLNQSPRQVVLEIESLEKQSENLRETMVVNVTEPISRSVDVVWESRVVGRLTRESTEELLRRARSFIGTTDSIEDRTSPLSKTI